MIWLYIILGIIGGFILVSFILALICHNMFFGKRFEPDPLVKYYSNEEFNIERIKVSCKAGKETLSGFIYNPNGSIKNKVIVWNHGMNSTVDAYNQEICYFASRGYTVIAFNHIGVSTSTGKSVLGFSGSLRSLDYVLRWVENGDYGNRDIYVMGHSWGGFAATNIVKYHPLVKKVVAFSPFISINRMLKTGLPPALIFIIPFVYLVDYMKCGKYAFANSVKSLNEFNGKALVLASTNDFMVNYELNTGFLKRETYKVKFYINKDRYHNPNYTKDAVDYMIDYTNKLNALKGEAQENLKRQTDFKRMGALDFEVMAEVLKFIEE